MPVGEAIRYQVRVLGPISVEGPDGHVDPGGSKPRLLLSLLVAAAGSMVSTERLIDGLWGEDPPATARKTVQVHVSNIRRSLGAGFPLETTRAGYRIDRDLLWIDAVRFAAELVRGTTLLESSPAQAGDVLAAALQLWTGPPYADVADQEAIRPEVLRLAELRLSAIEQRIDADLRVGRHDAVLGELETLTIDHPFRERLRALQMVALYRSGRQADALRTYERTRLTLADELGLDPGPALRLLYQKILDQSDELDLVVATSGSSAIPVSGELPASSRRSIRGYELRERLGERRDGNVFRAYQASIGREVALRVTPPAEANQPEFVKRFEASCQLLAELAHPHIVGLYDYWRDPDGAYVAMPLLRGGTLEQSLERSLWRPPAALHLLDQIGAALGYAHRRGVVHGDVRASNVLLDEDGNAFLSDFAIDGCGPQRPAGQSIGVAADVYGLAVITCEMLAGTSPQAAVFTPVELPSGFGELIQRATHPDPAHRFERVADYLRGLRQCFGADVVSTAQAHANSDTRNPFKGLRAFRETDAMDFFGRDDLLRELIERVSNNGLTAVVGPSGSGKSSLVKAGLVPACRRGGLGLERDLVIAEMFPGFYPFEELESALMGVAVGRPAGLLAELSTDDSGLLRAAKHILPDDDTDLLLIIDQFEELFALTADESVRQAFLASLSTVACDDRHRVRVVVTLRADFFDRPLSYPTFGELLKSSMTTVTVPGESSLAEMIAEPARRVGLEIEPGLVPTVLHDVANQPGALPMLQYALTELADRRDGNLLTIDAYRRTGGVIGALATRAEEIFAGLSEAGRDAAREVFVRLVSVSDETDDTRRRVRRTELEGLGVDPRTLETVIDAFGSFRLLSFDRDPVTRGPTVEVAHEALIREWPRYRHWIDERRDDLRAERRLESAATEWLLGARDPSFLVSGVRLERYEQWIDSSPVRLTADERAYIEASRDDERQRQERTARRRRRLLTGASTLAVVALMAAAVAIVQRNRANDEARAATVAAATTDRLRAEAERSGAIDHAQVAMGRAAAQADPELRILLALEEHDALQSAGLVVPAVTSALYQATYDDTVVARLAVDAHLEGKLARPFVAVAASPDGSMFVVGLVHGSWSTVDAATGAVMSTLDLENSVGSNWDRDDGLVMTGRSDGIIEFWKPTGERIRSVTVSSLPVLPLMVRSGQLAFGEFTTPSLGPFRVVVRDLATGREVFRSPEVAQDALVSPSGSHLAIFENSAEMRVYETTGWTDMTPDQLTAHFAVSNLARFGAAWTATGEQLWVLAGDHAVRFDVETGEQVATIEDPKLKGLTFISESRDGRLVAMGAYRTPIRVYTSSGEFIDELVAASASGGQRRLADGRSVTWAAGRHLVDAQGSSTVIWNLGQPTAAASFWPEAGVVPAMTAITPSGERILGSTGGGVTIFDASGRLRSSRADAGTPDVPALVAADGLTLAAPHGDAVEFVDIASDEVRAVGPPGLTRPLGISNDGRLAVLGTARQPDDRQHRVAIVDTTTARLLVNLGGLIDGERAAFTSDGRKAVIPYSNPLGEPVVSEVRVVDVASNKTLGTSRFQDCVQAVAISHDDTTVASLGCGGDVVLLDLAKLTGVAPWTAVIGRGSDDPTPAVGVTFGPDDDLVIVTRKDGRVEAFQADGGFTRLWSFDTGDHAGAPEVRDGMVWVGATYSVGGESPAGGMIAMPLDEDALVGLARATATRSLTAAECQQFLAQPTC